MTDIVIKPSNSGGSVKLQTEDGTNGLTMASTGDLTTSGNVAVTGTMTGGTLGSGVTFPAGHNIFIKSQNRSGGGGAVYRPTAYYPTTTSEMATKSFYLTLTSSEHSSFSKISINFHANFRVDDNTEAIADYRLVRWTGTGNISSPTVLIRGTIGLVGTASEVFESVSGTIIDDISSVGDVQINYTLQYQAHNTNSAYADNIYFGQSGDIQQISAFGII